LSEGTGGGALFVGSGSGVVNVVNSHFTNNQASSGGAIFHQGHMVNVVGSKFLMNKASTTVSVEETHVRESQFYGI
jgi:predicted outer membrane repeat protein